MDALDIAFLPHWRREVADVADTLRAVKTIDASSVRVVGGGRLPQPWLRLRQRTVAVVSDGTEVPARTARLVVRLWWNGADEVLAHQRGSRSSSEELHVCFFPDVAHELHAAGVDAVLAPYVFAAPRLAPVRANQRDPVIGYTGEVDISDSCFARDELATRAGRTAADLGRFASTLAATVVAGERSLIEVHAEIAARDEFPEELLRTLRWAVRNRVRHELMSALVTAFPGVVRLRGDDWRRLGFAADPTSFNRRQRLRDYETYRVCLDLGSKSTEAALYPRSAEIMALAGGIAQFDSGCALDSRVAALASRRSASAAGLVAIVERLLATPNDELADENLRLQSEYVALRLDVGRSLLRAIDERANCSSRPRRGSRRHAETPQGSPPCATTTKR
jgi:hypothetical protein